MYSLRVAIGGGGSSSTGLGIALGRFGGKRGGGGAAAAAAPSSLFVPAAAARGWRSVSATSNAAAPAPTPGDQDVGMEQGKQQHQLPQRDAAGEQGNTRDDMHKMTGDVMTHSFGEGYSTRSDEEGFGGVYGKDGPVFKRGNEVHPSHPEYDTSQGSEVKEKEKARHYKDDKHVT